MFRRSIVKAKPFEVEAKAYPAVALQHEYDHLEGC